MVQYIIVGLLLAAALIYLGRILYRSFKGQASCDTGCAKCNAEESIGSLVQKK
jgi:hypothetical protein